MAEYTNHLRLVKPQGNEYYNIEQFNHNAELIDKETEKLSDAVTKIQEGATREKPGIVQYGTTEGKALEGMMLARMFGCVGYGGDIQEPGVKDINYLYYDRNTRKMYKCLNQNSDVSANVANFIPLDNNSLLDRLENLFSFNLIKSSQNKGYKFYTKHSYVGNYIDVSDTFSTVDFCLISPARSELTDAEARFINYQGFVNGKILINAYWLNGNSLEKKYSATPSNTLLTASCVAFVYGTLK